MREYFATLAAELDRRLLPGEFYTSTFAGEVSDFVRFNRGQVRQAGRVTQQSVTVDLIEGRRHAAAELTLTGVWELDQPRLAQLLTDLRQTRAATPDDPYLLYATEVLSSSEEHPNPLPDGTALAAEILHAVAGLDFVGILACGTTCHGFANALGQRNWYARPSFNLDWSLYLQADKAVKARYAGLHWDSALFHAKLSQAAAALEIMARPARTLSPGRYRAYLSPQALAEIIDMLTWGGFSARARHTKNTPLIRMIEQGARLNPAVTLRENTAEGVAPPFQGAGFVCPPQVTLIGQGGYQDSLVGPRSAAEFGLVCNGAAGHEAPLSLDMAAGALAQADVPAALDTGLLIGNLWYLNYSDRNAARLTGMTRFATFWVENGQIQAPVNVLRFDDTVYHLLGNGLEALTGERDFLLDPGTYEARSTASARLPGALIDAMSFTL